MMITTAAHWINTLNLLPHPEGGFYRETYRDGMQLELAGFSGARSVSTAIYYLLQAGDVSHLHRIRSDEMWHFYCGSTLSIHTLDEMGKHSILHVGLQNGAEPQCVVPAGQWFGAELVADDPDAFVLVGCTVAPGFDFADFELASASFVESHQQHKDWMVRLLPALGNGD